MELLKGPGLESLVPDDPTVTLPKQDLDAIAAAIEEEEEMPGEGILSEVFANHALKTIESFSHIRWSGAKENCAPRRGVEQTSVVSPARAVELSSRADCSLEQAGVNGACESYSAPVGEFDLQLSGRAWIDDGYWHERSRCARGHSASRSWRS